MGLQPKHRFFDIGCGSLRGGVHFIRYLDKNNYFGTDISSELIKVGIKKELTSELRKKNKNGKFYC